MIVLRPDQQALKNNVYAAWSSGLRYVLGVLPTGGGKSVIVSDIILDRDAAGATQCVIAHRTELVGQMSLHVARRGIQHSIIGSKSTVSQVIAEHRREFNGQSFYRPGARCTVASVDTLLARADDLAKWGGQVDDWTIDEAHHVLRSNKWGRAALMFPRARGLGVTATPQRADGAGLGAHSDGIFEHMLVGPSTRDLMNIGAITDYEYVVPESDFEIDENELAPSGDFSSKRMRAAAQRSHIVGDIVTEYIKFAYGKKGITFATDVETAGEIAEKYNQYGISAAAVSAKTPDDVRAEYIRRFRSGQLWQLVNVDLFGEGFDVPAVEVVSMGRPTASLAVYKQQAGRAFRAFPGKFYGLIIDHVSNYKRHGLPDKDVIWTLDRREKRAKKVHDPEEIELVRCRNCSRPYERAKFVCPHCGFVPVVTPMQRNSVEAIDGDLILLDRAKLAEMRAATQLESPASVAERVEYAAGANAAKFHANAQIEKIQAQQRLSEAIAVWAGYQRARGRDDSESYRRFYLTTGVDVLSALALSRPEMERLHNTIQGWIP